MKGRVHFQMVMAVVAAFLLMGGGAHAQSMKISSLNDLALGSWSGSGDLFQEDALCVYFAGVQAYQITARGDGAGNAFTLAGSSGTVPYLVHFKGSSGAYDAMSSGSARAFGDADTASQTCGGVANAMVKITATEAALGSAAAGSYSGTLTLLLEPN